MTMLDEMRAAMIAQADAAAGDDAKLFDLEAYCNRYTRQPAASYTGPKMRDGNRVPQAVFVELETCGRCGASNRRDHARGGVGIARVLAETHGDRRQHMIAEDREIAQPFRLRLFDRKRGRRRRGADRPVSVRVDHAGIRRPGAQIGRAHV